MLPLRHRLQLRRTLPFYVFEHKAHFAAFSLYWHLEKGNEAAQAAIVVPKKVAPTAVLRNRLKRVFRAQLSTLLPTLPPEAQLVILVRRPELEEQLDFVLQTIREKVR